MQQQTIAVSATPTIMVESIHGDLRVAGWDRSEIMAKTDGESLQITAEADPILIVCDEDLILYLPRQANLHIDSVSGDAALQALSGHLTLGKVSGDITLNDLGPVILESISGDASFRNVGSLNAQEISGDFTLRGAHGDCTVVSIGGDASIRDVEGAVRLDGIGSDLYLRNARGAVDVSAAADVVLYLEPRPGLEYHIQAGDDLLVRLPPEADVELQLSAGSSESIHVDFPGVSLSGDQETYRVTLGNGAAKMSLKAASDLMVTSRADKWDSVADFGIGMQDGFEWPEMPPIPPIPPIPPDLSDRINRRVRASLEKARVRIEAANRRTEARVAAAMRRAEAKARAAEARARGWQGRVVVGGRTVVSDFGKPPEGEEAVSDQERLTILKLLQEKKISLEEAEKLLVALEGK